MTEEQRTHKALLKAAAGVFHTFQEGSDHTLSDTLDEFVRNSEIIDDGDSVQVSLTSHMNRGGTELTIASKVKK